jgi:twitching motility protein PilI
MSSTLPRFQHQLQEALDGAAAALDDFVGVRLPAREGGSTDQCWLIDAGDLQSSAEVATRSILGGLQPWVLGISQVRGQVHTLADMAVILGQSATSLPAKGRLWATLLHARFDTPLALVWPELVGMMPRESLTLVVHPVAHPWVRRQWRDATGEVWNELAVEQLVLAHQFNEVWQSAPGLPPAAPFRHSGESA